MPKFKSALTLFLFVTSCMVLVGTHVLINTTLLSYGASYVTTFGERVAAATPVSVALMANSAMVCYGALLISVLAVIFSLLVAKSLEAKRFWTLLITCCNFAVCGGVLSATVSGFFLLPRLANGA